jgi:cellulose synthase/poly-beta-1,6-N-acetylglucosamine synthase-like glycosyltransferase
MAKLSFVIPAYNEEVLLPQCLEAALKELERAHADASTPPFEHEVIVVNNASKDRTKEIALSYPGVTVVDEPTKGLVHARRAGFVVASGEVVANIDADTMLPKGWVTKVVKEFSRDEKLVGLSGPFIYYDLPWTTQQFVKLFYLFAYMSHVFVQHVLRRGAMLQGGNFVIRKNAFESVGGFDTSIEFYGEDTDVARRLSQAGKVKWTFALPMYSSGRRASKEGLLMMSIRYTLNHYWVMFTNRPLTREHTDIRPKDEQ